MNQVIMLLGQLFLIGCLHMIMNMLIEGEKMPFFSRVVTIACYAGSLFLLGRFIVVNLMPQMASIFRIVL
ncbi:MAG: hypothetical protein FWC69_02615 [Defluviitaleaceae bacterium]|nr:hypothetical protein [Defluviitaleaceae bacterium]